MRIRHEVDEDTAVCGYCGATVSLIDFSKQRRRAAIGTMILGFLVMVAGIVAWKCTTGWQGYFGTESFYPYSTSPGFHESKTYDFMPILRMFGTLFSVCGAVAVFIGLKRFLGWKRSWR